MKSRKREKSQRLTHSPNVQLPSQASCHQAPGTESTSPMCRGRTLLLEPSLVPRRVYIIKNLDSRAVPGLEFRCLYTACRSFKWHLNGYNKCWLPCGLILSQCREFCSNENLILHHSHQTHWRNFKESTTGQQVRLLHEATRCCISVHYWINNWPEEGSYNFYFTAYKSYFHLKTGNFK